MRADEADERDRADEGDGRAREQAGAQETGEAQARHVHAETARPILPEAQGRQLPRRPQGERTHHRQHDGKDQRLVQRRARQAAHGPEHELLERLLARHELRERDQRIEREEQRDSEQHDGLPLRRVQPRKRAEQQHRAEGEQERVDRNDPGVRHARETDAEHDGERRAERGGRRHAEREGARHRIVEEGLHLRAGEREGSAHQDRHQRLRQAHLPDDDRRGAIERVRHEEAAQHVGHAEGRGTGGEIDEERRRRQRGKHEHDRHPPAQQRRIGAERAVRAGAASGVRHRAPRRTS